MTRIGGNRSIEKRAASEALAWVAGMQRAKPTDDSSAPLSVPAAFRVRFAQGAEPHHLPERFDDVAAALYYDATDPPLLGDQARAVKRLLARRRQCIGTPHVTAYEEQDPHFGRWTMSVLAYGTYGDYKLVNGSYIHLNNPPVTVPPRVLDIHVCWGVQFAGAANASILQGITALIVDDWRNALRAVPVRFHLHRLGPMPRSQVLGRGGHRWRNRRFQRIPPANAVAMLFERANRARSVQRFVLAQSDGHAPGPRTWWCACLLEEDLKGLGFQAVHGGPDGGRGGWMATGSDLPEEVEHVLIIPASAGPGRFHTVVRTPSSINLQPIRSGHTDIPDTHWWRLRVCSLDLVLDQLLLRMR